MNKKKQYPSQERLKELFYYDPDGFLVWNYRSEKSKSWNSRNSGSIAGSSYFDNGGYRSRVSIDGIYYNTMYLIYIFHKNKIPDGFFVKSKSSVFSGLKIEDMILSESSSEMHNGRRINYNANGYMGVRVQENGLFQALGCSKDLGTYKKLEAAAEAYDVWARSYYGYGFLGNNSGCVDYLKHRVIKGERNPRIEKPKHKYQGVCINPKFPKRSKKKWRSIITINKKQVYLGVFETQEQAAIAYNTAALNHYGESAVLNTVPDYLDEGAPF